MNASSENPQGCGCCRVCSVEHLLVGSLFAPPSGKIRHNQTTAEDTDKNREGDQRETFWQRTLNDPTAFFTLWVAAFTGVLGFSTIGLWFVTRIAANAALRQANVTMAVSDAIDCGV